MSLRIRTNFRPQGIPRDPVEYPTESDGDRAWGYTREQRGINILVYDYIRFRVPGTDALMPLLEVDRANDKTAIGFRTNLGFDFIVQSQSRSRREQEGRTYRVQIAGRVNCTCDDFKKEEAEKCKHIIGCQYFVQFVKEGM